MQVTTIGLDLAKSIFQVHGTDAAGRTVLKRRLRRAAPHERAPPPSRRVDGLPNRQRLVSCGP